LNDKFPTVVLDSTKVGKLQQQENDGWEINVPKPAWGGPSKNDKDNRPGKT